MLIKQGAYYVFQYALHILGFSSEYSVLASSRRRTLVDLHVD